MMASYYQPIKMSIKLTWATAYRHLAGQPKRQAALLGKAWTAAAGANNSALLLSLLFNTMTPVQVCETMDWAGVPFSGFEDATHVI